MSRFIRLYEKKRGHRRTGSQAVGNFGEALFFGLFLALGGVAFAAMLVVFVWPEWRVNRQFASTPAVVLEKQVGLRAANQSSPAKFRPEIKIRYQIDGRAYETTTYDITGRYSTNEAMVRRMVDQFEVGKEYTCWYDPIDVTSAVVVRGYSGWLYLLLLIPLSSISIGGAGLIFTFLRWNASAERRALLAQRAAGLDLFEDDATEHQFPTVPTDANLTNSPGTTLAYRLPIAMTTNWTLFAVAAACLLWNAVLAIFVVMAIAGFARGEPDWTLAVVICPFVGVGVALVYYLARQVLRATRVGPTRIEISDHPLIPGRRYELFLSQAGRLSMNSLEVYLACDEQATFRQGTDTRTERRRVYEDRCFVRNDIEIPQGLPFESRCELHVPETAMHSFHASHNSVNWNLIVKGSVTGWPEYQRVFQIVVNPAAHGRAHT